MLWLSNVTPGSEKPMLRQVKYGYDPVGQDSEVTASFEHFPFIETSETKDSVPLNPDLMNVPWWSSFKGCRQSNHWVAIEDQVEGFLTEIRKEQLSQSTRFPYDKTTPWSRKEKELMETAVLCSIYMFPEGSPRRAGMIAIMLLMAFVHDGEFMVVSITTCTLTAPDVIEFFPDEVGVKCRAGLWNFD